MQYDIRAGTVGQINQESGDWLFVDMGFSSKRRTCGVLKHDGNPCTMTFGSLVNYVIEEAQTPGRPLNLLVEAPLSATFNENGNPTGRFVDEQDGKSRYWYTQPATSMMVATSRLLDQVIRRGIRREIRLFEGFASFKPSGGKSNHKEDVLRLRCAAWRPMHNSIFRSEQLRTQHSCQPISAFALPGMNVGVPPVVMACDHGRIGHFFV